MKKTLSSLLFLGGFLLIGILIFLSKTPTAHAQLCLSNDNCPCWKSCFLFNCSDPVGGDYGYACDYTNHTSCYPASYYDTNHNHVAPYQSGNCGYVPPPNNVCGNTFQQPSSVFCSKTCAGSCSQAGGMGSSSDTCGAGSYCSQDYGCTCKQLCSYLSADSYCALLGHQCASNFYYDARGFCGDNNFSELCCTLKPVCNTDKICGAWGPGQNANACGNVGQTRTCHYSTYNNSGFPPCQAGDFTENRTVFLDNCYNSYTCTNGNVCTTNIFVHVYNDWDHNGSGDSGKSGVYVSDNGGNNIPSDGSGNVTFTQKATGNYTITETVPADFQAVNATSQGVTLTNNAGNATVNFLLTPLYSISGRVFADKNKDQKYDGSDTGYGTGTIHISGGPTAVSDMIVDATAGTWATPTNLLSGNYTVTYTTSLANGYHFTTPSSYVVTVGDPAGSPDCSVGGSPDGTCGNPNNGSISNLNIGLINENIWQQSVCWDVRNDSGTYTDEIPAAPACGGVTGAYNTITNGDCSTGAGIVFTCNATPDFGLGSANANNWQAGGTGASDQECFSGAGLDVVRTSYDYLLTTARESNIIPTDMSTVCGAGGIANCTLPNNLAKGVYQANGDVHLNAYTFPFDAITPQSYIFLIDGDLYLNGNIIIPQGSVAAFSTSSNIYVDKSVGNVVTDPSDPAVNDPNLEGLYSADKSFIIQTYGSGTNLCNIDGTPIDKKLNVIGSIVTNAAKNGGSLINNRDLCVYDLQCSSISVGDNNSGLALSYLLTLFADGKFLTHKLFNWQELRP